MCFLHICHVCPISKISYPHEWWWTDSAGGDICSIDLSSPWFFEHLCCLGGGTKRRVRKSPVCSKHHRLHERVVHDCLQPCSARCLPIRICGCVGKAAAVQPLARGGRMPDTSMYAENTETEDAVGNNPILNMQLVMTSIYSEPVQHTDAVWADSPHPRLHAVTLPCRLGHMRIQLRTHSYPNAVITFIWPNPINLKVLTCYRYITKILKVVCFLDN